MLFRSKPKNQFAPKTISIRQEQKSRKKIWWLIGSFVCLLLLAGIGWQYARTSLFIIKQVKLNQQIATQPDVVPADQMQKLAKSVEGRSLLMLDTEEMTQEWAQKFPTVSSFSIQKQFPDVLEVRYTPRVAYSQLASPETTYLVDRDGFIFAEAQSKTLPKLETDSSVPGVGKKASARGISLGMHLIEGLRNIQPKLRSIVLSDGQLEVRLASQPLILVHEERPAPETIQQIKTLLAKFKQDESYPKVVDMRYERPVLRY